MKKIILASTSPRRKDILSKLHIPFEIINSDYEEDMTLDLSPELLAEKLSQGKALAVVKNYTNAIIIAADTFISYDGHVLGKPKTKEKAVTMLSMLSGNIHQIITGVTIIDSDTNKSVSFHEITTVYMKKLSPETMDAYINTGEPLDKAGAYALQEKGAILIEKIEGDFFNAMGLPLSRLADELTAFSINLF